MKLKKVGTYRFNMSEYSRRKFKLGKITSSSLLYEGAYYLRKGIIYTIGSLVKKELLVMNSEMVYQILDASGKCVYKSSYLEIKDNLKNGTYVIVW